MLSQRAGVAAEGPRRRSRPFDIHVLDSPAAVRMVGLKVPKARRRRLRVIRIGREALRVLHRGADIRRWAKRNKVQLCFTPAYASCANPIEAHFGPLRRFTIANSHHPNHPVQSRAPQACLCRRNANARHRGGVNKPANECNQSPRPPRPPPRRIVPRSPR
ncbi:hypothetical protein BJY27_000252 [Streptomyces rapamycinicus]|uniref:Transposase n=2 Tax=Streptomyces rapamycinicus TaxID=1226757 RepID=A0A3L8R8P8_STRRN|nr:hypothetical protein [Streptomyces rapamycinicus]RLV76046.1 transposase [Streptomyces rapamycinicus NRRL 5491]